MMLFLKLLKDIWDYAANHAEALVRAQLGVRRQTTIRLSEKFTQTGIAIFKLNLENIPVEFLRVDTYHFRNADTISHPLHNSEVYFDNSYTGELSAIMGRDIYFPLKGPSTMTVRISGASGDELRGSEEISVDLTVITRG